MADIWILKAKKSDSEIQVSKGLHKVKKYNQYNTLEKLKPTLR